MEWSFPPQPSTEPFIHKKEALGFLFSPEAPRLSLALPVLHLHAHAVMLYGVCEDHCTYLVWCAS